MDKGSAFGKKEIFQFGILIGFFFLGYYMWDSRDIMAKKRKVKDLPENLKDIYKTLREKGYKPQTNPVAISNPSVFFEKESVKVSIAPSLAKEGVLSVVFSDGDKTKPPYTTEYKDGVLAGKNGVTADADIVSAILQVIENKDYK